MHPWQDTCGGPFRKGRDSNPRNDSRRLPGYQPGAFSHSATLGNVARGAFRDCFNSMLNYSGKATGKAGPDSNRDPDAWYHEIATFHEQLPFEDSTASVLYPLSYLPCNYQAPTSEPFFRPIGQRDRNRTGSFNVVQAYVS